MRFEYWTIIVHLKSRQVHVRRSDDSDVQMFAFQIPIVIVFFFTSSFYFLAVRTKPPAEAELGAPAAKKIKRGKKDEYEKKFIQSKSSVLSGDVDSAAERLYKPKTPETKQTYEVLLSFIQVQTNTKN